MYEIELKVNSNGTLKTMKPGVLHLGTKGARNSVTLKFDVDENIEGIYRYVKFYHPKCTVLQRVVNNKVIISTNVFVHSGIWLISFLSSDATISYASAEGTYIFATVPIECHVCDGLLDINILDENLQTIERQAAEIDSLSQLEKSIIEMSFQSLEILDNVDLIGDYFMYKAANQITKLTIGKNVKTIGIYAFYDVTIDSIVFPKESKLESFRDCAFSHAILSDIVIPSSLSDFGHYFLNGGRANSISFEKGSKVKNLSANSFNNVTCSRVILPDGLTKFAGNGYVIRNCRIDYLWISKSVSTAIPKSAFYEADGIKGIVLESGFDISANFSNCNNLTKESIVEMFHSLKDRTGLPSKSITIGSTNIDKLQQSEINIALEKNWTVS